MHKLIIKLIYTYFIKNKKPGNNIFRRNPQYYRLHLSLKLPCSGWVRVFPQCYRYQKCLCAVSTLKSHS